MKKWIYWGMLVTAFPVSAQTKTLSVAEYRQKVLDYSQQIKQSAEQRMAMQEAMRTARTAYFPQLDFSGNVQYRINDYEMDFAGVKIGMASETYNVEAGLVQNVYGGGAVRNRYKAAEIQRDIAQKSEELTVDNIVYAADVSYWSTTAKKDLYLVISQYVDIIRSLEKVVMDRFTDGYISKTDLLQVQSRLKDAELQKSNAYKAYQIALQNLNILMGQSPQNAVEISDSITMLQALPPQAGAEAVWENRPEYGIAGLNVDYQKKQLKLTQSKYLPVLSVGIKETWGTQMLNIDGSTMWNSIAFASVSIPVFHWGARSKDVNMQKAVLRSREYDLQMTKDQITQEVSNAWTNLTENTKQIRVVEEACKLAEENLDLNTFSYTEGRLPVLDVLSAQVTWIQAYSNLIQTWLQQKVSLADYNKAVSR
ncbi:MAG: TolC family protein [Oscillibacter sp.]|nr:TolC family protein [Oscillibacter sp.]